jgi:hypothetical protein
MAKTHPDWKSGRLKMNGTRDLVITNIALTYDLNNE